MPIPVRLSDVVDQMDMLSDEASTYLNRRTGEMVFVSEESRHAAEDPDEWDDLPDWELKDTLRRLGIEKDWYRFREEAFKEIARDWLQANNIPFVE